MACAGMYLVSQQRIFCLLCCSYGWICLPAGAVPTHQPPAHLLPLLASTPASQPVPGCSCRFQFTFHQRILGKRGAAAASNWAGEEAGTNGRRLCARLWGQDCSRRATEPVKQTQDSKTWCKAGVALVRISCNPKGEYKHVLKLHSNERYKNVMLIENTSTVIARFIF